MLEILYLYCRGRTYCDPGKGQYECTGIKKDRIGFTKARESGYIYICMGQFTRLSASFAGDHDQSLTAHSDRPG